MSVGFGDENLYLFEEGARVLTVIDVGQWQAIRLDFSRLGLGVDDTCLDKLAEALRKRGAQLAGATSPERQEQRDDSRRGLAKSVHALAAMVTLRLPKELPTSPLVASAVASMEPTIGRLWLRAGDAPAETFHADDYDLRPIGAFAANDFQDGVDLIVDFTESLDEPHMFAAHDGQAHALISLPGDYCTRFRPDPLKALPILNEYIGPGGVGVDGVASNMSDEQKVTTESSMALPLGQAGALFWTMYLHLNWGEPPRHITQVGLPIPDAQRTAWLEDQGFQRDGSYEATGPIGQRLDSQCEVWTREQESDVIHVYDRLPGRETMRRNARGPVLLAVRSGGSFHPDARHHLMHEIMRHTWPPTA